MPWDISRKCTYGRLEQQFKLALPDNIELRFCDTSFKTFQNKSSIISTSLVIFIFLTINTSKWETSGRFHQRFHHYRAVLLFRSCRFCFQWVHKTENNKFKILIAAINRCIVSTNVSFHTDKQHGAKLAITVLQLIFPSLFLAFNLIMIHPRRLWDLEFSNILSMSYEWNEMLMLTP